MDTAEINKMSNLHIIIIIIIIIIGHAVSSPNNGVLPYKLKMALFVKKLFAAYGRQGSSLCSQNAITGPHLQPGELIQTLKIIL